METLHTPLTLYTKKYTHIKQQLMLDSTLHRFLDFLEVEHSYFVNLIAFIILVMVIQFASHQTCSKNNELFTAFTVACHAQSPARAGPRRLNQPPTNWFCAPLKHRRS